MEVTETSAPSENLLRELGLTTAADGVKQDRELARKLRIAMEFYQVVKEVDITAFNKKLEAESRQDTKRGGYTYKVLAFTTIEAYKGVPPADALLKLKEAQGRQCFDVFEVATIESREVVPDPIIFGRIVGSTLRFAVAQWDTDICVADLIGKEEGWPTA